MADLVLLQTGDRILLQDGASHVLLQAQAPTQSTIIRVEGARTSSVSPERQALTVCPFCWGVHAECPYSAEEAAAVRKARKAATAQERRSRARTGLPNVSLPGSEPSIQSGAGLRGEMSDAASVTGGLFATSRRRRGPKPSQSRQARYRRRHPERAARDLAQLRTRRCPPDGALRVAWRLRVPAGSGT